MARNQSSTNQKDGYAKNSGNISNHGSTSTGKTMSDGRRLANEGRELDTEHGEGPSSRVEEIRRQNRSEDGRQKRNQCPNSARRSTLQKRHQPEAEEQPAKQRKSRRIQKQDRSRGTRVNYTEMDKRTSALLDKDGEIEEDVNVPQGNVLGIDTEVVDLQRNDEIGIANYEPLPDDLRRPPWSQDHMVIPAGSSAYSGNEMMYIDYGYQGDLPEGNGLQYQLNNDDVMMPYFDAPWAANCPQASGAPKLENGRNVMMLSQEFVSDDSNPTVLENEAENPIHDNQQVEPGIFEDEEFYEEYQALQRRQRKEMKEFNPMNTYRRNVKPEIDEDVVFVCQKNTEESQYLAAHEVEWCLPQGCGMDYKKWTFHEMAEWVQSVTGDEGVSAFIVKEKIRGKMMKVFTEETQPKLMMEIESGPWMELQLASKIMLEFPRNKL